jgi:hypothetical protein
LQKELQELQVLSKELSDSLNSKLEAPPEVIP